MSDHPRLLIVDDEPDIRAFIRDVAEEMKIDVAEAGTYEEFARVYERTAPDLIILDLSMPHRDGIEFLRDFADRGCTAQVVLSSGQDNRILTTARRLGRDFGLNMGEILPKPVSIPDLEKCLRAIISVEPTLTPEALRAAIDDGQLVTFYQPKVGLQGDDCYGVIGAEALVRWRHPRLGMIPPNDFIGLAEDSGLIGPLTKAVLRQVIDQLRLWSASGTALPVSVNLSPKLLVDLTLPDRITDLLAAAEVDPSLLVVEITERAAMADVRKATDILTRMRLKNISVSLDDFGAGYSSLVELYRMPLSELKLDRSLIVDIDHDSDALTVVRAILALARELAMPVCAEGIETMKTAETLRGMGCQTAQGFFFSRPLPALEFSRFVASRLTGSNRRLGHQLS